jgi:hypothetical protein
MGGDLSFSREAMPFCNFFFNLTGHLRTRIALLTLHKNGVDVTFMCSSQDKSNTSPREKTHSMVFIVDKYQIP